jgi:general secretion pathway protein F
LLLFFTKEDLLSLEFCVPSFTYRAIGRTGDMMRGEIEALSREAVLARLHGEGCVPLQVTAQRSGQFSWNMQLFAGRGIAPRALAEFVTRLATLVGAGVPLESAVAILADDAANGRVVKRLLASLRDGAALADAMAGDGKSFPPLVVSMVRAGELGGSLALTLTRLGEYLRRSEQARASIRSALIYPAILLLAASASVVLVFTAVLPALRPMVEAGGNVQSATVRLAFATSDFFARFWWLLLLGAIAVAVSGRQMLHSPAGRKRLDGLLLRVPFLRMAVIRADFSRFARTLGTLIGGGVPMPAALEAAGRVVSNTVLAAALDTVARTVREGGGLAEPLGESGLFPDMAVQIVRIGETTGQVDTMLLQLAEIMEQDLSRDTARALALLVPLITVGLGMLVAGIVASVMLAVLSINDLAQ